MHALEAQDSPRTAATDPAAAGEIGKLKSQPRQHDIVGWQIPALSRRSHSHYSLLTLLCKGRLKLKNLNNFL
jgi:hypothetical protein